MVRITVAPDFMLDDTIYEAVKANLGKVVPGRAAWLTWAKFTTRENWCLIPDVEHPDLPFFKAEFIVLNEPPWRQTIKVNVWMAPDLRRDARPIPHNHPWKHPEYPEESFSAYVLDGWL